MYLIIEATYVNFTPPKTLKNKRLKVCYWLNDML